MTDSPRHGFFSHKTKVRHPFVFLLLLLIISCAGPARWNTLPDQFDASIPTQEEYPDECAVILLDEGELEMFHRDFTFSIMKRHRLIKIFDARGFRFANITIPYSSATTVTNIRARTIAPDGRIFQLQKDHVFDVTLYPAFIFFSDIRAKRFTLPGVQENCLIEIEWQKQVDYFTYWDQWNFQDEIPTRTSRYRLRIPSEWDLHWISKGIDLEAQTTKMPSQFKQDYLWQAENLPSLTFEPAMPASKIVAAALLFSPIGVKKWSDVASWYHSLSIGRRKTTPEITETAERLTHGCTAIEEKLEKLYEFVRDEIRYVAIAIGIGGYQPHFASDTFFNRYGDCKDKVTLLSALAASQNIQVDPVLISTWQNGPIDTSVAGYTQFNHVIARAQLPDSSYIWMDPTESLCSFGELPWYDEDRSVLTIHKDGAGEWQKTPTFGANRVERFWRIDVDSWGICHFQLEMNLYGARALLLRDEMNPLRGREQKSRLCRQLLTKFPKADFREVEIDNLYDYKKPVNCHVSWTWRIPDWRRGYVSLSLDKLADFQWQQIFVEKERRYPIDLAYCQQISDSLALGVPDEWTVRFSIRDRRFSTEFGFYHLKTDTLYDGQLSISRKFALTESNIPVDSYSQFREFINRVAQADESALILNRKNSE